MPLLREARSHLKLIPHTNNYTHREKVAEAQTQMISERIFGTGRVVRWCCRQSTVIHG